MLANIDQLKQLAEIYNLPVEDVFFTALNLLGISHRCEYNRARLGFQLVNNRALFPLASISEIFNYYLALPIQQRSPFVIEGDTLFFNKSLVGKVSGLTEDICDSNYTRRGGTVLNLNPNRRTSCRGCRFCYTAYQTPRDNQRLLTAQDLENFFDRFMELNSHKDLSHLIQVAVVTGCFDRQEDVSRFILLLRQILNKYAFTGEIFYIGSQIVSSEALREIKNAGPIGYCISLECFSNRGDLLRDKKRAIKLEGVKRALSEAQELGFRTNFTYVLGLDDLDIMHQGFEKLRPYIGSFPIVNLLQLHKYHPASLRACGGDKLDYYFQARKYLEDLFIDAPYRPRSWENYRSPWYLKFAGEALTECRTP